MATGNYKVPPAFDEKNSYESWKNEVEIWRLVSDMEKKKQFLCSRLIANGKSVGQHAGNNHRGFEQR